VRKGNFKVKLVSSYFFLILASLGVIAFSLDKNLQQKTLQEVKQSLIHQAYLVENRISVLSGPLNNSVFLDALSKELARKIGTRITVIGLDGKVLADSEVPEEDLSGLENHLYNRPEISQALDGKLGQEIRYSSTLRIDMLYLALPIKEKGRISGILRLALPLTSVEQIHLVTRKAIFSGLVIALALAIILGLLMARMIIRPVNRIIRASLNFAKGDFSHRILEDSNDEIGELAATLNKMAQDTEDKIREIDTKSQHLEAIFNSMVEGVIVTDSSEKIISINHEIEELFDVKLPQAQGKFILEGIRNSEISVLINQALKGAKFISKEIVLILPKQKSVEVNVSPIFEKDKVTGCLAVLHDITQIKKLENMRRDFVANVSHELKTPLTSIKGFVETLLEGALQDKDNSIDFLKIVDTHVDRLNRLIDDLLELAHLESKEIVLNKAKLNLSGLADQVIRGFKSQAKKKGVEIKSDLPADLEILADPNKLEQVFSNLIHNAIKYNKEDGFVRIWSEQLGDKIRITIEDSGSGIPVKDLPRIFERFYRVDKARSRQLGGTGLGLSIVKHAVELHAGSVGVESTEGIGSRFWFILPQ